MYHNDDRWHVNQCLAGRPEAFEFLVKKYERGMMATARRMVKHPDDACDLVQEAFLKAYQALADYRVEYAFSTWLYRILINLCLNFLEKRRNAALLLGQMADQRPPERLPVVERREFWSQVEQALQHLSAQERSAFVLANFENIPVAEIANIIECPKGTVCWLLFQARKKLQALLDRNIWEECQR